MPMDQAALNTPEREQLRKENDVRLIAPEEEGNDTALLPTGVYGFTTAPGASEIPLFAAPVFRCTEVHKTVDGEVRLIGYFKSADAQALAVGAEPFTADLYPEPYEDATTLVCVPVSRLDRRRPPARDHGNPMRVDVAPRP